MDSMRIKFREKSNLVADCDNLQMMIGYVKVVYDMLFLKIWLGTFVQGDIEGKKGRMKVVEQDMAKAEEKKKEVEAQLEVVKRKQEEERRARLMKAIFVSYTKY